MSTVSKRTLLILLILSVSIGLVFAEGQAELLDNDSDFSIEDMADSAVASDDDDAAEIENESLNGLSGVMGQGRSRGNGMSVPRGERKGELKYVDAPGVLVTDVFVDSPADIAGVLRGDVIISVEGVEVPTINDITLAIEGYTHGQGISLVLLRAENELDISLTLETRIGYPLIGITGIGAESGNKHGMGGFDSYSNPRSEMPFFGGEMIPGFGPGFMFEFEDGESDAFSMMDIPEDVLEAVVAGNAALITEVVEGSPAAEAGIAANMIVIALDGNNLEAGDLSGAVLSYEIGGTVELTLADMSGVSTVELILGDNDGKPFLGVTYIPLDLGGKGFRMPFDMPGQRDRVFQSRPNMVIPELNNN